MTAPDIHPTAIVAESASLADGVFVGPYCVLQDNVEIGPGTRLDGHVIIYPDVAIGAGNRVWPNAVIGGNPQDLKFKGAATRVVVGDENHIREGATIHRGTEEGGGVTRVGSNCLLMAYSHIAHDCQVGDHVILGNNVLLAGHIIVGDHAYICGGTAINHFTTIGKHAYIGGLTRIVHDVPPFLIVEGNPSEVRGVNVVGLSRRGFSKEQLAALREAYKILFVRGLLRGEAIAEVAASDFRTEDVNELVEALRASMNGRHGRALEATRSH